ncbi:hypothetical protein GGI12_000446 [Dipsacomyces acuminosporus]|nr:hypothetical protein GGI12_000446 [Dipsacomyces acuminosporus]
MERQPSAAQSLPAVILEEVIYYATGLRRFVITKNYGLHHDIPKSLVHLIAVCSHWRSVGLPIFYMRMSIQTSGGRSEQLGPEESIYSMDNVIASKVERVVKHVAIDVPCEFVFDGRLLDFLSSPRYSNAAFPSVLHITFHPWSGYDIGRSIAVPDIRGSALRCCERVKQLFPNTKFLYIEGRTLSNEDITSDAASILFSQLAKHVKPTIFKYTGLESYLRIPALMHLDNLTCLELASGGHCFAYAGLMKLNAATLEDARLVNINPDALLSTISGPNGTCIAYPRLKSLTVTGKSGAAILFQSPDEAPFPALKYLHFSARYPFDSDVLFRGSSQTLEWLELCISPNMVQVMRRFKLFQKGGYPRLNHIALRALEGYDIDNERLALSICRIPFEAGPQMERAAVEVGYTKRRNLIMDAIRLSIQPHALRCLDIHRFRLSVTEVVEVLEKFPNLMDVNLNFQADEHGGGPFQVEYEDFYDYHFDENTVDASIISKLHQTHFPLAPHLRSLSFTYDALFLPHQKVLNFFAIATLIPSLRFAMGNWLVHVNSCQYIRDILSLKEFAPYLDRLHSLTYMEDMERDSETFSFFQNK